jgi:tetratricopeptide (TPR) repeat protein
LIAHETKAYDEATSLYARALEIRRKSLGPEHPAVAAVLTKLADVHASVGAVDEARTFYEQALEIYDALDGVQEGELDARFNEARALLETGGDRQRAIGLATAAADGYREQGNARAKQLAEVVAWLGEHGSEVE